MDKCRKNFIISDSAIYYCLICDEVMGGTILNVEKHIRWDGHRKNLKNQAYFPKFRKDFIYKVENHFYCELCNLVVSHIDAVTKHLNGDSHKAMKENPKFEAKIIGEYDSGYITINKIKISMAQWNSIVDQNCLVCDMEVAKNSLLVHMQSKEHILKIIASEIKCENNFYYRKIDDDKYHCFSCKKVFSAQKLNNHWPSCKNIDENTEIKNENEVEVKKSSDSQTEVVVKPRRKHHRRLDPLLKYFSEEENENVTCNQCKAVVAMKFMAMVRHLKTHYHSEGFLTDLNDEEDSKSDTNESSEQKKRNQEKFKKYFEIKDHGKQRLELAKYGKEHSIKLNYNGSKGWCFTCDRYLSAHKNIFEEHVNGSIHQGNLELQGRISPTDHEDVMVKTKSILQCRLEYIIVDKQFCVLDCLSIDVFSFFLICDIEDRHFKKTKCFACNELFPQGQEREHCSTTKHKNKFLAAKFVTSFEVDGQFIREIRKNYFHCGLCNKTMPFIKQMVVHVLSMQHRSLQTSKTGAFDASVKFNTKSEDVYTKLLQHGFGKV